MILTLKRPGTSVKARQSHQTVTDLWCGQIPRRGSDAVLTLILTNSPEKSWVTFTEQWHYCFKKKKRYGLLLRMHNAKVPSKSEHIFVPMNHNHNGIHRYLSVQTCACKIRKKIDMFLKETFLFLKLIVPITCKLLCIFTVKKCQ